jgi:hypothetical protein
LSKALIDQANTQAREEYFQFHMLDFSYGSYLMFCKLLNIEVIIMSIESHHHE